MPFERELQSGAETPRKDGELPQQPNKQRVDLRWLKMEPLTQPAGAVAANRGCPAAPALPGKRGCRAALDEDWPRVLQPRHFQPQPVTGAGSFSGLVGVGGCPPLRSFALPDLILAGLLAKEPTLLESGCLLQIQRAKQRNVEETEEALTGDGSNLKVRFLSKSPPSDLALTEILPYHFANTSS